MPTELQKDPVVEARAFLPEVTQERKSALCKAVTHKVVLGKAEWLMRQLCDEVERLRSSKPRIKEAMIDEILACDKCDLCEEHHA